MARGIPRFEASDDLFERALAAGLTAAAETPPEAAPAGPWRSLRLDRLEALAPDALVPPPLLRLTPDAAFDVAEAPPEEVPPSPQDLEQALSEAVDLPDDWARVASLAGDTHVARCLKELLDALDWTGAPRQVAEVLPILHGPLDGVGAARVLDRLGFHCRTFDARLNELGPQDFPCLFVTKAGDALVLAGFGPQTLPGFDGASRTRRPVARDRRQGTVHAFSAADTADAVEPAPPSGPAAFVWQALRPRARALAAAAVAQGILALAGPLLLLVAFDHAVPSGSVPMILFFAGAAALAILAEAPFRAWRDGVTASAASAPTGLGLGALTRTLLLPPDAVGPTTRGARRTRYEEFHGGGAEPVLRLARAGAGLPAALAALVAVAWLGGVLVVAPLAGMAVLAIGYRALRSGLNAAAARAVRASGAFVQQWRDMAAVRAAAVAAGCEETPAERLARLAGAAGEAEGGAAGRARTVTVFGRWVAAATVIATAAAGAQLVQSGAQSAGALAACVLLAWSAMAEVRRLADGAGDAARLWCGLAQAGRLHALKPERRGSQPSLPPRALAGHVDVSGLSTGPAGGVEMPLDGVSLYADPGEVVAVVGDYQSGKSALLRVLAGLQAASAGHARLDGVETGLFDPVQLRQSVAYVPEWPEFLPLSIEDNLRLMNPVASDADIQDACTLAGAMDEIRVLETGVGANRRFGLAVNMGTFTREPHPGFFKRLALARGYVRRSGLILLDGPERHLDPEGEQALLRAVEALRGEATVIVATDRPQIIRLADRVLWLEAGRTRAEGPSTTVLQQLYEEGRVGQTLTEL